MRIFCFDFRIELRFLDGKGQDFLPLKTKNPAKQVKWRVAQGQI
jgi:hypothetical protein